MGLGLDELAPTYLREQRITLTLDESIVAPAARRSILVNVDYSDADPEGVSPPLILEVQGPSAQSYVRRVFHTPPDSIVFIPQEGGTHQVTLREAAHNYWYGALRISVAGELIEAPRPL